MEEIDETQMNTEIAQPSSDLQAEEAASPVESPLEESSEAPSVQDSSIETENPSETTVPSLEDLAIQAEGIVLDQPTSSSEEVVADLTPPQATEQSSADVEKSFVDPLSEPTSVSSEEAAPAAAPKDTFTQQQKANTIDPNRPVSSSFSGSMRKPGEVRKKSATIKGMFNKPRSDTTPAPSGPTTPPPVPPKPHSMTTSSGSSAPTTPLPQPPAATPQPAASNVQQPAASNAQQPASSSSDEYARYLEQSKKENFVEEAKLNFIYQAGNDTAGRPVIVVLYANLPVKSVNMDRLLLYVISVMDSIVKSDYSIVFVQTNGSSANRPSFAWLRKCYRMFSRNYKKNLKSLYIVHPTFWTRTMAKCFKPFISSKFWQKLKYVDDLADLYKFVHRDQLRLPEYVSKHGQIKGKMEPIFGATLEDALDRPDHADLEVPVVVDKCIKYLMEGKALELQGIFRLSGSQPQITQLKKDFDKGENVNLSTVEDPHVIAGLLKLYLRELPEPLFPFEVYDKLIDTQRNQKDSDLLDSLSVIIDNEFPPANKAVLRSLLVLLTAVESHSATNKMTSSNLSIVFAPTLIRSREDSMQQMVMHTPIINSIMRTIIENSSKLMPVLQTK
eukprot:TRINITY_DN4728_c0_g1_i1.p1 TRINITY_DN4728_c0_g1~~TRINITY_DN4728_c0_g1_i1.p1  ORF type:complete len:615 (+),score=174.42 TRINITY_DN4728_c0_g1_i1:70-1914(+)